MSTHVVTWYDFLLKTADLDEFLHDYSNSPSAHPKPSELLVAFLQRLTKQEEDSSLRDSPQYSLRLTELSLKVTSQHFRWSLPELDRYIPVPLQHQLMMVLNRRYPIPSEPSPSPLDDLTPDQLTAHYLYSCWVVRLVSTVSSRDPPHKRTEIKPLQVEEQIKTAVSFLTSLLTLKKDIHPSSPFLTPPEDRPLPLNNLLSQTHFEVGRCAFYQMDYTKALEHFFKSFELFSHRTAREANHLIWLNSQQLQAFLDSSLLLSSEDTTKIIESRWNLEHLLTSPIFPPLLDLMTKPQMTAQLSKGFYHRILAVNIRTHAPIRTRAKTDGAPSAKRSKLDTSPEEAHWKLSLLAAIKSSCLALPSPTLMQLFTQMHSREEFDCFHKILSKLGFSKKRDSPGRPHSTHEPSPLPLHLSHLLFSNMPPDLREVYDPSYLYKSVHTPFSLPDAPSSQHVPSLSVDNYRTLHTKPPHYLKLSPTHQAYATQWNILNLCDISVFTQLISAVGNKTLSDAQHFAAQWTGSHKPFLQIDQVIDHTLLTRINAALHLGSILQCNKHLELSHKYFRTAVDSCQSANLKPSLTIPIHEKCVLVQIEAEIAQAKVLTKHTFPQSLVENAKNAFSKTSNTLLLYIAAAFLLNCKEYQFFSSEKMGDQAKFATGLANCCLALMESSEVRRHGRQIFDAMFRIMEGQQEQDTELKTGLGIFFNNLIERLALSLSISCFVKLVTLLENPKWEISSEHTNCWPAAIPNVERLDRSQVSRFFLSLLEHAIETHPNNCQNWLITKADYLFNNLNYNMALKLYIEAGALASNYFEAGSTPEVWTEACLRHILDCLSMLREIRYALLLSQLLRPVDYQLSLNLINELFKDKPSESATPSNFIKYVWDINVLEYLGYLSFQKKHSFALNGSLSIIPADLNTSNSEEILNRAIQWRRTEFLRSLADYLLIV